MDRLELKYGKTCLTFSLKKENFKILQPLKNEPISNPEQYLANVIDNPMGCSPLDQIFHADDHIVIIVSDITRYTGAKIFLPLLLQRLNNAGIRDSQISILFALGIHRALTDNEKMSIVGDEVARRVKLIDHNPDDRAQMEYIGETLRGTPILINRKILKSDGLILTGNIVFHYLAGFGGGGKALLPGVSARESCMAFHRLILKSEGYGTRPKSFAGIMENNLMQDEIIQTADKLSPDFLINTITDSSGKIIYAVSGELKEAHKKGCDFFIKKYGVNIKEKADLVIVSCGGYPKDINFIQAHKSIEHAFKALKEGGVMVVLAECSDGIGNSTFLNWFQHNGNESFLQALYNEFEINGQTAFSTYMKAKAVNIILISSLQDKDVDTMSMMPAKSIKQALAMANDLLDEIDTVYVIPDGANTLPA